MIEKDLKKLSNKELLELVIEKYKEKEYILDLTYGFKERINGVIKK